MHFINTKQDARQYKSGESLFALFNVKDKIYE